MGSQRPHFCWKTGGNFTSRSSQPHLPSTPYTTRSDATPVRDECSYALFKVLKPGKLGEVTDIWKHFTSAEDAAGQVKLETGFAKESRIIRFQLFRFCFIYFFAYI
jgi:hypothetical protein